MTLLCLRLKANLENGELEKKRMRRTLYNKKASATDVIFIAVVMLVFAMFALLGFTIVSKFDAQLDERTDIPQRALDSTETMKNHYTGVMDNVILLLLILLVMSSFVLASLVKISPIFIPFYFLALIFIIIFAGVLSNIYQEMAGNDELGVYADKLTFTTQILFYLPFIVGIIGFIVMVATYKLGDVTS